MIPQKGQVWHRRTKDRGRQTGYPDAYEVTVVETVNMIVHYKYKNSNYRHSIEDFNDMFEYSIITKISEKLKKLKASI